MSSSWSPRCLQPRKHPLKNGGYVRPIFHGSVLAKTAVSKTWSQLPFGPRAEIHLFVNTLDVWCKRCTHSSAYVQYIFVFLLLLKDAYDLKM